MIVVFVGVKGAGTVCVGMCADRLKRKSGCKWKDTENGRKLECV